MRTTLKILKYEFHDVVRNKWVIIYTAFFFLIAEGLFRFGGDGSRVIISLMNVTLLVIPLMCVIFGTMYVYNAREFVELLLSQPIGRKSLFAGMYAGLAVPLAAGFAVGVSIPFLIREFTDPSQIAAAVTLLGSGIFLTFIFVALAFLVSLRNEDKGKGFGIAVLLWLFFAVIYDGLILLITLTLRDYPMEKPVIAMILLNPIDLARIVLILQFDISALMGYTGAVFQKFFGTPVGMIVSVTSLAIWTALPLFLGLKRFTKKDF